MKDISYEILDLLDRFHGDCDAALRENEEKKPGYLFALSKLRENLLEWYEFDREASLLEVGSDYGALTGLFSRKVQEVVVLEDLDENLEVNKRRHGTGGNIRYVKGTLMNYEPESAFDYVVMVGSRELGMPVGGMGPRGLDAPKGSLEDGLERQVEKAKSLVKPGGELIAAVHNRFAMRYWAGAVRDGEEPELSLNQLKKLLPGAALYYPMPDYRLPVTVYSEWYLPRKGDLTNIQASYDYPKYQLFDEEKAFDALCRDGQFENFANSYLAVWRKG